MERPLWAPGDIDLERPSVARVYDYYLGGSHNFAVDREIAHRAIELMPDLPLIMQANRAFLRRAVRYYHEAGVTQFLDIGSGIPTVGSVHSVIHELNPDAAVVYVDIDPVAVAHSRAILEDEERVTIVQADLRAPEELLAHLEVRRLLDLSKPVGVLMVAVFHFIADEEEPSAIVGRLYDALAPGSYLALTHASHDGGQKNSTKVQELYARTPNPMTMRSHDQVVELFKGFSLVEPGVVFLPCWHPDTPADAYDAQAERFSGYAGVGRKT